MSDFNLAIPKILHDEGSAFIPDDHGRGPCKYGITLKTAQEFYPQYRSEDIYNLTPDSAAMFYKMAFWDRYHVGSVENQAIANLLLFLTINIGGGTAVKLLQRVVGVMRDGNLGPKTAASANKIDAPSVLGGLKIAAKNHYRAVVAARPDYANCLDGWLARVDS